MRVMYVTWDPKESYVKYGEREEKMEGLVVARAKRYEREHMCDAPANQSVGWRDPGYIHDALITGLKKGKRYYYKVFFYFFFLFSFSITLLLPVLFRLICDMIPVTLLFRFFFVSCFLV